MHDFCQKINGSKQICDWFVGYFELIQYRHWVPEIGYVALDNRFQRIQLDKRIRELHGKRIAVTDTNRIPYNVYHKNLNARKNNKQMSIGKFCCCCLTFRKLTFWADIFTVSTHPSIIANAIAVILATSGKIFTFANLIAVLSEIPEKRYSIKWESGGAISYLYSIYTQN